MHVGSSYRLSEFLFWTREDICLLIVLGIVPVVLYQVAGLKWLSIPWAAVALLAKYLSDDELKEILRTSNRATQILVLQSRATRDLYANQEIVVLQFVDMQRLIKDLHLQQERSERIKDFPFPRQFATVCSFSVKLFCLLLPFGLLREFDKLNESVEGFMKGNMVWLALPVGVVIWRDPRHPGFPPVRPIQDVLRSRSRYVSLIACLLDLRLCPHTTFMECCR